MGQRVLDVLISSETLQISDDLGALRAIQLMADTDDELVAIAARAMELADVLYEYRFVHFATHVMDDGRRYQAPYPPAFVDSDGRFSWPTRGLSGVTVADLERASEAGVFAGDPHALIVEQMTSADGVIPDSLEELISVLTIGSAAVRKLIELIRRNRKVWESRNGTPRRVLSTLQSKSEWRADDVAWRFAMSRQDAEEFLDLFGYVLDDDGWFRLSGDPERVSLRRQIEQRFLQIAPEVANMEEFVDLQRRARERDE
jgi:hypothetical protein